MTEPAPSAASPPSPRPLAGAPARAGLPALTLTETQARVIRAKYQRDDPAPEVWLWRVAANLALAEVIHGLPFERVAAAAAAGPVELALEGDPPARRLRALDPALPIEDRKRAFDRFLAALARVAAEDEDARALHEPAARAFYALMASARFLPNSPTLMNAGRPLQQLAACYVLPVPDTLEGITDALRAQALIHQSGGGTGFGFGRLRPAGARVASTEGVASGPVTFMEVFDKLTDVIKQGGTRRGANMGILPVHHPDIRAFIHAKERPGRLENFNLSVAVDGAFFEAARGGGAITLRAPHTGLAAGSLSAAALLDEMAAAAWATGDPGLVFLDRMNGSRSNPVPLSRSIEATNPCGEQPLYAFEPCNLGSLNLAAFARGPIGEAVLDRAALGEAIDLAVRLLDDVIEVNRYPLPEIEDEARRLRRIGLGVMGFAEYLVLRGLAYDSDEALAEAEAVMAFIDARALAASEALARERGAFPAWRGSIYDPESPCFRGVAARPRHGARTTIAPTGTIALAAGLQGGGIEPFFGVAYTRLTAQALDAVRRGEAPPEGEVYVEVNPLFRRLAAERGFFGLEERALWQRVASHHGRVRGLALVPAELQRLFATAHDVSVERHIRMQAAFQRHTDNAVSKTINLPREARPEDVRRAFVLAWEHGLKGITVYRDGSKDAQVLSVSACGDRAGGAATDPEAAAAASCPSC